MLRHAKQLLNSIAAIAILTIVFSTSSIAQDEADTAWSYPHYDKGVRSLMDGLHEQWRLRDGVAAFEIADGLFWALLLDPNEFYIEFTSDTVGYQRFAEGLDYLVFTNQNDTVTVDLENLRQVAIWRLTDMTWDIEPDYMQIHQKMIEAVKRARVRIID